MHIAVSPWAQIFFPHFPHQKLQRPSGHSVERRLKRSPTGQELPGLMVRVRPEVRGRRSLLCPACPSVPPRLLAALSHPICPHPQRALSLPSQPLLLLASVYVFIDFGWTLWIFFFGEPPERLRFVRRAAGRQQTSVWNTLGLLLPVYHSKSPQKEFVISWL